MAAIPQEPTGSRKGLWPIAKPLLLPQLSGGFFLEPIAAHGLNPDLRPNMEQGHRCLQGNQRTREASRGYTACPGKWRRPRRREPLYIAGECAPAFGTEARHGPARSRVELFRSSPKAPDGRSRC